jgi:hypothetical protein
VGLRTGPALVEKGEYLTLQGLETRPLGPLARSQSLYRLRYSGSFSLPSLSLSLYIYIYIYIQFISLRSGRK